MWLQKVNHDFMMMMIAPHSVARQKEGVQGEGENEKNIYIMIEKKQS